VLKNYGREAGVHVERRSEDYWKDFDNSDPRRTLCHRLAELLGPVWVTREVARHLWRLLAWEIGRAAESEADRIGEPTQSLSLEEWHRVRDGLADSWDWWGEGVHLRPQPIKKTGHWYYEDKPLAVQVIESKRLRSDLKQRPIPSRTTSVDAHLGDGLFLLTTAVHAELALIGQGPKNLWTGHEFFGDSRRYQIRSVRGQKELVMFAPSGEDRIYLLNYCARINAGGYRPLGLFPSQADLRVLYLGGADLNGADLHRTDLRGASLRGANLSRALLFQADLSGADLSGAYLNRADLSGALLLQTNLSGANLSETQLIRADLSRADLSEADLRGADLSGADLSGADLRGADLRGADLSETSVYLEQLKLAQRGK
jgi:hypothetical protein